jgi:hypothetical protein
MRRGFLGVATLAVVALLSALSGAAFADSTTTTPYGTWTASPGQSTTYGAAVQQPINADGSSNFKANGKAVIPVKFALSQGTGAFIFESYADSDPATYPYSFLEFDPNASSLSTLANITQLIATYNFTVGHCQTGSLRWTLYLNDNGVTRNLDIHYQPGANGISGQFCQPGTSGANMANTSSIDPYVVINQFTYAGTPYTFSSPYNVTYAEAVAQLGSLQVLGMNLVVDSGSAAEPEKVNLTNATVGVGGTTPYSTTFTPAPASPMTSTCPTLQASIRISKVDGLPSGDVNEPLSIQPQDNNGIFRIVDCKYMYNLATSSLSGVGTYTVYATIGSTEFTVASFDLK